MKTITALFLFCLAVLPSIIHGGSSDGTGSTGSTSLEEPIDDLALDELETRIDAMIENGETINNVFKPVNFLGRGGFSVNYKGELGRRRKIVAMKIAPISMLEDMDQNVYAEYNMYTYLKAVNNESIENYGIPAVHYFNPNWEGCTLLAITLMDKEFADLIDTQNIRLNDIDALIIMREFVRITKYIHSRNVYHNDIKLDNLMFRRNKGFIIDFNWSERWFSWEDRKRDWKDFLIELGPLCGLTADDLNPNSILTSIAHIRNNDGLRNVFMHFGYNAFQQNVPINYNHMHLIISQEIYRRGVQEPAMVSWLSGAQINQVIAEFIQTPAIETIPEPNTQFTEPEPVNLNLFRDFR